MKNNKKDFISITDLSARQIWRILLMAKKLKNKREGKQLLKEKQMVLLFEKPSLRTKLSFDIGFSELGGHSIFFGPQEVSLGMRESVPDVAKVLSSMVDLIVVRVFNHQNIIELAQNSKAPVINALSDLEHPCQILADLMTIWEIKGYLKDLTLAYIGDGENNIPHSLVLGCVLMGINFRCASPKGFWMNKDIVRKAKQLITETKVQIIETDNPKETVEDADVVYTDTWISMGDEGSMSKRLKVLKPYQVNHKLMKLAKSDAIFMHDLPAYRENEVSSEVIDGSQSVVFEQAENRLHVQKALMIFLLKGMTDKHLLLEMN